MTVQTVSEIALQPVAPPGAKPLISHNISVQEYLDRERISEIRHEFVEGEMIEMAGETPAHNAIAGNVFFALRLAIGNRPCTVYFENIRLRVSPTQYRYPDVMALCSTAQFDNDTPPALLNPSVIVEVLSPSTQATDRTEKFLEYRQIPGLTDYVLVAQDALSVVHYTRQSARRWSVIEYTDLADSLPLASLEVSLTLAEIYAQISFPVPTE